MHTLPIPTGTPSHLSALLDRMYGAYSRDPEPVSAIEWSVDTSKGEVSLNISGVTATLAVYQETFVGRYLDTFSRSNSNTWGTASDGNVWTLTSAFNLDPPPEAHIVSNHGALILDLQGNGPIMQLGDSLSTNDIELLVEFSFGDFIAVDSVFVIELHSRFADVQPTSAFFGAGTALGFISDGTAYLNVENNQYYPFNWDSVWPNATFNPGDKYWIRFRAVGDDYSFRVWRDGTSEPTTWLQTITNSTPPSGSKVGLYSYDFDSNVGMDFCDIYWFEADPVPMTVTRTLSQKEFNLVDNGSGNIPRLWDFKNWLTDSLTEFFGTSFAVEFTTEYSPSVPPPPPPLPPPPAPPDTRTDTFQRPDQVDWGTSSDGHVWIKLYPAGTDAIENNQATQTADAGGASTWIIDQPLSGSDVEILAHWKLNLLAAPLGKGTMQMFLRCAADASLEAVFQVSAIATGATARLTPSFLVFSEDGATFSPSNNQVLQNNVGYWTRFRAVGTLYMARTWADTDTEPTSWDYIFPGVYIPGTGYVGIDGAFDADNKIFIEYFNASTVTASYIPELRSDRFNRPNQAGWGTMPDGQVWSTRVVDNNTASIAGATAYLITDNIGQIDILSAGPKLASANVEVLIRWLVATTPGPDNGPRIRVRSSETDLDYAQFDIHLDGTIGVVITNDTAPNGTWAGSSSGVVLWTRVRAEGSTYKVRTWRDLDFEPTAWDYERTSPDALLPGRVLLSSISLTPTASIWFDYFSARTLEEVVLVSPGAYIATDTRIDTFERPDQADWGTASDGHTWVRAFSSGTDAIESNQATQIADPGGTSGWLLSPALSGSDVDVLVRWETDLQPSNSAFLSVALRSDSNLNNLLLFQTAALATGASSVVDSPFLVFFGAAGAKAPAKTQTLQNNRRYWTRVRAVGRLYMARTWLDTDIEPTSWDDIFPGYYIPSLTYVGVFGNLSSGDKILFSHFAATTITADSVPDLRGDRFQRDDQAGWGTMPDGHVWTTRGVDHNTATISGSTAKFITNGTGDVDTMSAGPALRTADVEVLVRWSVQSAAGPTNGPRIRVRSSEDDTVYAQFDIQLNGNIGVSIISDPDAPGGSWAAADEGDLVWTRVRAEGAAYKVRAWHDSLPEPSAWDYEHTAPASHPAGRVLLSSISSFPTGTLWFDHFSARTLDEVELVGTIPESPTPAGSTAETTSVELGKTQLSALTLTEGFSTPDEYVPPDTRIDTFQRPDQVGWGTASDGHTWESLGWGGEDSISSNTGKLLTVAGSVDALLLGPGLSHDDREMLISWTVTASPSDPGLNTGIEALLKSDDTTSLYAQFDVHLNGQIRYYWGDGINNDFIAATWAGAALGQKVWTRLRVVGLTYSWKLWKDGHPEPSAWTGTHTTSVNVLGKRAGLSGLARANGNTMVYHSFSVVGI